MHVGSANLKEPHLRAHAIYLPSMGFYSLHSR